MSTTGRKWLTGAPERVKVIIPSWFPWRQPVSDILNTLRETATNPDKAKETLAGLHQKWSEMSDEQRTQATQLLAGLQAKWSEMSDEQRAQAAAVLSGLKDKLAGMPDDAKGQINDLLARLNK